MFLVYLESQDYWNEEARVRLVAIICNHLIVWRERYEQGHSNKPPPKVASVFISPTDTDVLYVECRSPIDCGQLMSVFNYSPGSRLVPLEDRPQLLSLPSHRDYPATETLDEEQVKKLSTHTWVRTRDGDVAYIVEDCNDRGEYEVLRLPMLPLEGGGSSRRLLSYSDILTLLDPKHKGGRYKTIFPSSTLFWVARGTRNRRVFLGGLEQITIPASRVTVIDSPNPQDLLPFVDARQNSLQVHEAIQNQSDQPISNELSLLSPLKGTFFPSEQFEWLTADILLQYADRFCSSGLDVGDRVAVKNAAPTELHGAVGFIVESDADHVKVQDSKGLIFTVHRNHLRKVFEMGDTVRVLHGPREGTTGLVLAVNDQVIHFLSGSMEELQKSELPYQQSNSVRTFPPLGEISLT